MKYMPFWSLLLPHVSSLFLHFSSLFTHFVSRRFQIFHHLTVALQKSQHRTAELALVYGVYHICYIHLFCSPQKLPQKLDQMDQWLPTPPPSSSTQSTAGFSKREETPGCQRLNWTNSPAVKLLVVKSSRDFFLWFPNFPLNISHGSKTQQPSFPNKEKKKKKHHHPSTTPPSPFCPQGSIPKTSFATKKHPPLLPSGNQNLLFFANWLLNPQAELRPFPILGGFPLPNHHFGVT